MRRILPNLIEDIETVPFDDCLAEQRFGADLLGRAVGHAMVIEGDEKRGDYAAILTAIRPTFSQSEWWLTHTAISEVMIGTSSIQISSSVGGVDEMLADPALNPLGARWEDVQNSVWDQVSNSVWE